MITSTHTAQSRPALAPTRRFGWLPAGLLVLLPVLVFFGVWQYYAVNVPKWDDHALRGFLHNLSLESTFSGKIYQFFQQHNEHRIVFDRVVTYLDYRVFGTLSYTHLMLVGNLSLVGLLILFGQMLRRSGSALWDQSLWYAAPVAFLLFNLSHWENMFWGMAALQNFTVVLWVLWSLYLLAYTNRLYAAILLATLATLTSGNGLTVWPIGLVLLLHQHFFPKTSPRPVPRKSLWLWLLGGVVVMGLYFVGYQKPDGNPPARGPVTDFLKGFLAFTGSVAEAIPFRSAFQNSLLLGAVMTLLTVGLLVLIALKQLRRERLTAADYFFAGSSAFLLGTAIVVAWSRVGFGLDLLITSRYKLYSCTLLALLYAYVCLNVNRSVRPFVGLAGLLGGAALAWLSYLSFLDETIGLRHWLLTNQQFNWTYTTNRPVARVDSVTARYTKPAPAFYDTLLPTIFGPAWIGPARPGLAWTGPAETTKSIVTITKTATGFQIDNESAEPLSLRDKATFIVARSAQRTHLFPVRQQQHTAWQARFWPGWLFKNGFRTTIFATDLDAGTYQLLLLTVSGEPGKTVLVDTRQTITLAKKADPTFKQNW
ncbi:hypothetical protein [Spirosoma montaniterrae]|uniref:hypothetical protein n=1 Tax=Spirosoma montaniterrae TaxID=1178516 RepID=UPI00097DDAA8|nr:hypothetical protein [Spirosoma montaniterrae]